MFVDLHLLLMCKNGMLMHRKFGLSLSGFRLRVDEVNKYSKLTVCETNRGVPDKKEYVQDRIQRYTDTSKAITITEDIFENRPITKKAKITRKGKKKERKKKKKN